MTPEQQKVKKIADNYIALKKAIEDPNYPSTTHTTAALKRVEDRIRQMGKNHIYNLMFKKLIPLNFDKIMADQN